MAGSMVYRLRVSDSADSHMERLRHAMSALQAIRDRRGFNQIAGIHGVPGEYCWHHQESRRSPVQARLFLPWHRAYLWWLEQALQDQVSDVAIAWWDWTRDQVIPDAYSRQEIEGQTNPLYAFQISVPSANPPLKHNTQRSPGQNRRSRLPTPAQINELYEERDWPSFSDSLQIYHNQVHGWVGGDMAGPATAAFDPIFFAHHCMVDRIWYLWQIKNGNSGIPSDLLDHELIPFGKRFGDVLDVQSLGYEYAATAVSIRMSERNDG